MRPGPPRSRNPDAAAYLSRMPTRQYQPCIPTRAAKVPAGRDWLLEIKHDGYRLIVQREDKRVRRFTRNGHDWTDRYPLIVEAALRNRSASFVVNGEAVLLRVDGVSDFDGLHSRKHDDEVQLYAFDCMALDGGDLRKLPLSIRKANLARLLARRPDGIFVSDFEQGEIGPELFRKASEFGLEGLVSKHRDCAYGAGTSPNWVNVKNPKHAAVTRVIEAFRELLAPAHEPVRSSRHIGIARIFGGTDGRPACPLSVGSRLFGGATALARHLQRNSKLVRLHGGRPDRTIELCRKVRARLFLRHVFQLCDVICCPAAKGRIGHWLAPSVTLKMSKCCGF
jgi:bifunctional non-homologous end joining protein LigD